MSWHAEGKRRPLSPSVSERYSVPLSSRYRRESEFNSPPRPDTRYRPLGGVDAPALPADRFRSPYVSEYSSKRVHSSGPTIHSSGPNVRSSGPPVSPQPPGPRTSPVPTLSRDRLLPPAVSPRIGYYRQSPMLSRDSESQALSRSLQAALEASQQESRNLAKQLREVQGSREANNHASEIQRIEEVQTAWDADKRRVQSRIAALETELRQYKDSSRQQHDTDQKVQSLERQLRQSNDDLKRVDSEFRSARSMHTARTEADGKKLRESASTILSLQKDLKTLKEKKGDPDVRNELLALQERCAAEQDRSTSMQTQLHKQKNECLSLQDEKEQLMKQLSQKEEVASDLQSRYNHLAESNKILKQHETTVQQKLVGLEDLAEGRDNDIKVRDSRITQLEGSLDRCNATCTDLEQQLKQVRHELSKSQQAEGERAALQEQLHNAANDVAQLNRRIGESEAEEHILKSKLKDSEKFVSDLQERLLSDEKTFEGSVAEKDSVIRQLQDDCQHMSLALSEEREESCRRNTDLEQAQRQAALLEGMLKEKEELQNEVVQLRAKLDDGSSSSSDSGDNMLQMQLSDEKERSASLEAALFESNNKVEVLNEEAATAAAQKDESDVQIKQLQDEYLQLNDILRQEQVERADTFSVLTTERDAALRENSSLLVLLEEAKLADTADQHKVQHGRIVELEDENSALQHRLSELEGEVSRASDAARQHEASFEDQCGILEGKEAEIARMQHVLDAAQISSGELEIELDGARTEAARQTALAQQLQEDCQKTLLTLSQEREHNTGVQERSKELEAEIETRDIRIDELQALVRQGDDSSSSSSDSGSNMLQIQLSDEKERSASLEAALVESNNKIDKLSEEVSNLEVATSEKDVQLRQLNDVYNQLMGSVEEAALMDKASLEQKDGTTIDDQQALVRMEDECKQLHDTISKERVVTSQQLEAHETEKASLLAALEEAKVSASQRADQIEALHENIQELRNENRQSEQVSLQHIEDALHAEKECNLALREENMVLVTDVNEYKQRVFELEEAQQQAALLKSTLKEKEEQMHAKLDDGSSSSSSDSVDNMLQMQLSDEKERSASLEAALFESNNKVNMLSKEVSNLEVETSEKDVQLKQLNDEYDQLVDALAEANSKADGGKLSAHETATAHVKQMLEEGTPGEAVETEMRSSSSSSSGSGHQKERIAELEAKISCLSNAKEAHSLELMQERTERIEEQVSLYEETGEMERKLMEALVAAHSHKAESEAAGQHAADLQVRCVELEEYVAILEEKCGAYERKGGGAEHASKIIGHLEKEIEVCQYARKAAEHEREEAEAAAVTFATRVAALEKQVCLSRDEVNQEDLEFRSCDGDALDAVPNVVHQSSGGIRLLKEASDFRYVHLGLLDGEGTPSANILSSPGFKGLGLLDASKDDTLLNLGTADFFSNSGNGLHVLCGAESSYGLDLLKQAYLK